ncbi:hypothetical protein K402DRAFT_12228 [Aulographum hederae CBS 113979]|uniref:Tetraspanin n=1 Tax=Aulographum hederae CBS 113979 TaxID=1176131 RepID=A0A6G1H7F1_9PEZI|nr:hypothetical protein K402DRAFT_12228 [Aulographum hederae CBS 113979]
MAYTKRQITTAVSIIYLIVLTALAGFATHQVREFSLPIPSLLSILTVFLPAISGLTLETTFTRTPSKLLKPKKKSTVPRFSRAFLISVFILTVYETAVAALLGEHIGPTGGLRCGLDETWRRLYSKKDSDAIRRIQDAGDCCGLHSGLDMAWPFPAKGVRPDRCLERFERTASCFEGWRAREQSVAGLMLAVVIGVFLWECSLRS